MIRSGSPQIRPFTEEDIPEVGRLHLKVFPQAPSESSRTPEAYGPYLRDVLLRDARNGARDDPCDHPRHDGRRDVRTTARHDARHDTDLPSLVCVADGVIVGFLGVLPLRLTFDGQPIRATCCTQFVVDPEHRGLTGLLLVRHHLDGAQDLSFTDECSPGAARIWEWSGAEVLPLASLQFVRPLRPGAFALDVLRRRRGLGLAAAAATPLIRLADAVAHRIPKSPFGGDATDTTVVALDTDTIVRGIPRLLKRVSALVPSYEDGDAVRWRLARAGGYVSRGPLHRTAVLDRDGTTLGWYIAYFPRGGVGEVLQIVGGPTGITRVLGRLFRDAWEAGVVALRGRVDPPLLQDYSDAHCLLSRRGPLMLVHSRDPRLVDAFHRGRAFLSRLEGEWCARFE